MTKLIACIARIRRDEALPLGFKVASASKRRRARQNDPKFGELTGLRIDLNRPAMLLDDDVVTNGKAQPSPFTGRLGRKERVEQFSLPRMECQCRCRGY